MNEWTDGIAMHWGQKMKFCIRRNCKLIITTVIVVRSVFVLHLCALALHFDILCQTCLRRTVSRCENTLEQSPVQSPFDVAWPLCHAG